VRGRRYPAVRAAKFNSGYNMSQRPVTPRCPVLPSRQSQLFSYKFPARLRAALLFRCLLSQPATFGRPFSAKTASLVMTQARAEFEFTRLAFTRMPPSPLNGIYLFFLPTSPPPTPHSPDDLVARCALLSVVQDRGNSRISGFLELLARRDVA